MFSKINKITTKTLRHYDEIGLLKPEHVDKFTGYRYYTSNQLPKLHEILTLKQMGLALQDIKQVIVNPSALNIFLKLKEEEIIKNIKSEEIKLTQIKSFTNFMKGEFKFMYTPIIKELPKSIVASMRKVVKSYDDFFYICPEIMGKEMKRLGCVCYEPSYCFNIYHDGEYRETDIDVEICERVTQMKEDNEIIKFREIDKVENAVCILHKGPYSKLRESYTFIFKWIEDNNYEFIDNPRESYIDGIWNKDNEEDWLTEIQVPIRVK
jgi:DNA-binding transcriptional MerR regulator